MNKSELEKFCLWLEDRGYLDDDWRHEEPKAVDEYLKERASEKEYNQRWYSSYTRAKSRCHNPKEKYFHRYGGRGIKFRMTLDEVKNLWARDKGSLMVKPSIDRVDNDGHYEYGNCRFIETAEHARRAHSKLDETHCKRGHFYDDENSRMRKNNKHRECRKCNALHAKNRYNAKKI